MNSTQGTVGHPCTQGTLLARAPLLSARGPRAPSCRAALNQTCLACALALVLPAQGQHLGLPLLKSIIFPLACSSSLSGSLWMTVVPSSVLTHTNLSFADLTSMSSVTSSRSLIKLLNGTSPRVDPVECWLLVTGV